MCWSLEALMYWSLEVLKYWSLVLALLIRSSDATNAISLLLVYFTNESYGTATM